MHPMLFLMIGLYYAIAIVVIANGLAIWREEGTVSRWASTVGTIRFGPALRVGRSDGSPPTHMAHITYDYTVAGQPYHSGRLGFDSMTWRSYRGMVAYLATITAGSRVTVYYDPGHPQSSVLNRRTSVWDYAPFLAAGVGLLLAGPALFRL